MSTQKTITPFGKNVGYLEARALAKERGGKLPSNVLHDEYLVRSDRWKQIADYYVAWAREVLVYPEKSGKFKEGKDIVDSETGWVLPASYVPKEAVERKGVGLFIDPEEVKKENGKVVVHPAGSVIVLFPFILESGTAGKVDEATRVPLALEAGSKIEKRRLWRIDGVGVRPLVRGALVCGWQYVDADQQSDNVFGVALETEGSSGGAEKIAAAPAPKESGLLLSGVTIEQLNALVCGAKASLEQLKGVVLPEKLAEVQKLLEALKA